MFASYALGAQPRSIYYLVLFLAVLGIYNADHAWDASRMADLSDQRRAFHARWRKQLLVLSACSLVCAGILSYQLRHQVILAGIIVGILMCAYFLLLRSGWLARSKEIFVSVGFTAGIWIPQMPLSHVDFRIAALACMFFLACALNLLALALADIDIDRKHGDTNLALSTSPELVQRIVKLLCSVGAVLAVAAIATTGLDWLVILATLQICIQGSLCFMPSRWYVQIRLIGDWGFVLFGLPWLFQKLMSLHLIN